MKKHHVIECIQPYFDEIRKGNKTFEVRINDRDYKQGDSVTLLLYDSETQTLLGEKNTCRNRLCIDRF